MISTSESQKLGIAWPTRASRLIALSTTEPSRIAAMMPSGMETISAIDEAGEPERQRDR